MAADERPVMEWIPRARVSLVVRFEEFGSAISSKPPATKQMLRKGTASDKDLEYVVDPDSPPGAKRYLLQPKKGGKTTQASPDKLTWPLWGIVPMTVNHTRNGLEKADTATVTLAFTDAPFDPRCIRSCAITYFLGTITADQAAAEPDATGPTMVPDTWTDARGNVRSNERFDGWVDSWEADYEDGVPVVKLECRDNRAVLIDQEAPPQLHLDPKLTLDKAVADYLSNFPQFAGISVEWRGDDDAPQLSSVMPTKGHEKGTKTGTDKSSVMDYLKEMCETCACILMMEGHTLVVTKPRTVYKGHPSRPSDAHSGANRTMNGTRLPYRTFVYGHNVKTMKFGRKYNAAAPTNLEVRCVVGSTVVEAWGLERAYKRWYEGPVVCLTIRGRGEKLTGTTNHPVLTPHGWIRIGDVVEGDELVCCDGGERDPRRDQDEHVMPTTLVELFGAIANSGNPQRIPTTVVDFHGDGMDSDVEIVVPDTLLRDGIESAKSEHVDEFGFKRTCQRLGRFHSFGSGYARTLNLIVRKWFSTRNLVARSGHLFQNFWRRLLESKALSFLMSPDVDPHVPEVFEEPTRVSAGLNLEGPDGLPGNVTTCKVLDVRRDFFSGHVYNLQTKHGWYVASGIITHNCYMGSQKKTIIARVPDITTQAMPGNGADKKWTVRVVTGITSRDQLKIVAQSAYEQQGRKELTAEVTTTALASFGGDNYDPDILDLLPGDTFDAYLMREQDMATTVGGIEDAAMQHGKIVAMMLDFGYTPDIANAYADAYVAGGFTTSFYAMAVKTDWDHESGVSISVNGTNYVEVRLDKEIT